MTCKQQRTVYGLIGRKQHGKTTFASYLEQTDPAFKQISFADPLKRMCSEIFDVPMAWLVTNELKEVSFAELTNEYYQAIELDACIPRMIEATGLNNITPHGLVARTPRQLMQYFGTDYVRAAEPNYWSDRCFAELPEAGSIPDVRFINEGIAAEEAGVRRIKIVRGAKVDEAVDDHPSEREIDSVEHELLLVTYLDDKELLQRVARLCALGYWSTACEHDYGIALAVIKLWLENQERDDLIPYIATKLGITRGTADFLLRYYGRTGTLPAITKCTSQLYRGAMTVYVNGDPEQSFVSVDDEGFYTGPKEFAALTTKAALRIARKTMAADQTFKYIRV